MTLRRAIYDEVRPYPEDKRLQGLPEDLALLESQTIHHLIRLDELSGNSTRREQLQVF